MANDLYRQLISNIYDTTFDIKYIQNCAKYIQKLLGHYWSRFRKAHLQELSEQQQYNQRKFKTNESLSVDDVFIIKDENYTLQNQWRQGKIINLVIGSDNLIRGASIRCVLNDDQLKNLHLQKLPNVNNNFNEHSLNESLPKVNEHKDVQQPKRTAAAKANAKIKLFNEDGEYMLQTILLWGV